MKSVHKIFTLVILLQACSQKSEQQKTEVTAGSNNEIILTDAQEKSLNIKTGKLQERVMSTSIQVSGKLEAPPQSLITISTPFAGFVKTTELLQGMVIRKGQVLAEMQHPDYIQLQQDYLEAKGQLEFLDAEYKRQQNLAKDNINSEKTLQQSKANYTAMLAKVQGLRSKLLLMNVDLAAVEKGEFTSSLFLYSPIDGYVTEVMVNIGKYVQPTDVMFKLVGTHHLHAEFRVFEKDVMNLRKGQIIEFRLGGDTIRRKAEVFLVGHEIAADRTVNVHGHIEKEESCFLPGMYISGEIKVNQAKVKVLPRQAVVSHEGVSYIVIMLSNKHYKLFEITAGVENNGWVEVRFPENADTNQAIVVEGAYGLLSKVKNGAPEF